MTTFKSLELAGWRQFSRVNLAFSSRLTLLTGPNGCGKTTVLNVLGQHFGWNQAFLTASFLTKKEKRLYADAWEAVGSAGDSGTSQVGTLKYSDGTTARVQAPTSTKSEYAIQIPGRRPVVGLHIPSHRPPPAYTRVKAIPVDPKTAQEHYNAYQSFLFRSYGESPRQNPSSAMKEALIGFAVFGEGNRSVEPNNEYRNILSGFESVLRTILPPDLGFESLTVEAPEVLLVTRTGKFPLEAMSGGLNALFGVAWQIHIHGVEAEVCTVLLDEPENHLHPSMQRSFLPGLLEAFPRHRFIVATHSPFVVASAKEAAVYAMLYGPDRRITSRLLEQADLAGSAAKVLREVLDVPITIPLWVERSLRSMLARFADQGLNADSISQLRASLTEAGLEEAYGHFLASDIEQNEAK